MDITPIPDLIYQVLDLLDAKECKMEDMKTGNTNDTPGAPMTFELEGTLVVPHHISVDVLRAEVAQLASRLGLAMVFDQWKVGLSCSTLHPKKITLF